MASPRQGQRPDAEPTESQERRRTGAREARQMPQEGEAPRREKISETQRRNERARELRMKNRIRSRRR